MTTPPDNLALLLGAVVVFFVIYVAYRIGKVILRVFIGLVVLALLSWWLWSLFHS